MTYSDIINSISAIVWGPYMIWLLVGTGVFITIRTGFIQFTKLGLVTRLMFSRFRKNDESYGEGEISSVQALMTALSSTVGVGNIAGVATAIFMGGPGAIFWMWVSAIFGMATKYGEITLALKYREKDDSGTWRGGAMYIWKNALHVPFMGAFFALAIVFVAYVNCNMVQANAAADALKGYGVEPLWTGVAIAVATALVIFGGIRRLGKISEILVPIMAGIYIIGTLVIVALHIADVPAAFSLIFNSAFNGHAAAGGFAGAAMAAAVRFGVARGCFSNEAGCGSAPIAHAAARVKHPAEQGLYGIMEVFIDTIIICTCTALAILLTGAWTSGANGAALSIRAFEIVFGGAGKLIVSVSVVLFAVSTILGWSWYGESALAYLAGSKLIIPYRIVWVGCCVVGAVSSLVPLWLTADLGLGLAILASLTCLLILSGDIAKTTKEYFASPEYQALLKSLRK